MRKAAVIVPVATVWTDPGSVREIDQPVLAEEGTTSGWIHEMDDGQKLDLCTNNRVQTQVLFGEDVLVEEEEGGWSKVLIPSQPTSKNKLGYPGWIPSAQIAAAPVNQGKETAIVIKESTRLTFGERALDLYYGTGLSVTRIEEGKAWVETPVGTGYVDAKSLRFMDPGHRATGMDLIRSGQQFLGLPYLWGGMSNLGYDCSGFVYTMCKVHGIRIPRDAHDQAAFGKEVALDSLEPGDALFFAYQEGKGSIHHVGFYYGDGKLLHSPKTGECIEVTDLKGFSYEKELCAARRYSSEGTL